MEELTEIFGANEHFFRGRLFVQLGYQFFQGLGVTLLELGLVHRLFHIGEIRSVSLCRAVVQRFAGEGLSNSTATKHSDFGRGRGSASNHFYGDFSPIYFTIRQQLAKGLTTALKG